jgi:hypothetical protein
MLGEVAGSGRSALRHWYMEELQPRLSRMDPTAIAQGTMIWHAPPAPAALSEPRRARRR